MTELEKNDSLEGIAVIGMSCRFPGADTIDDLWKILCNASETITFFSEDELDLGIEPELIKNKNYVRAKGIINDADKFDASFFDISPREAELMDPQQRIFLESSWTVLENAGYNPDAYDGLIGVFAGMGNNTYMINNVAAHPDIVQMFGEFQTMLLNEKDYLTTRVSYKLNLKGPSLNINTACSTSLVAVCHAFDSLTNYQCDMALAGGVTIVCPQNSGYLYHEGSIASPDGHCRPFDARAQGTVDGNGVGIVVLKRLEDAINDNDHIYAVIKGTAINNDGSEGKMNFTAPSVDGQAEVIAMALAIAEFDPETISYVETHGTATELGDPIEITALTQAFRTKTNRNNYCAIGSIKSNIGHLDPAAGIAGLIKTVLSLYHKKIPPSLNFKSPNPKIDFTNSPFFVNTRLVDWEPGLMPRRAGVSSFGIGGTNAHVVLEEAPAINKSSPSKPYQLLTLSSKTSAALDRATVNLSNYLENHNDLNLADVAFTLQTGRKDFNYRHIAVCKDIHDAVNILKGNDPKMLLTSYQGPINRDIAFMFSGQGSQYPNMGLDLYRTESVFREHIDQCSKILQPQLSFDLREVLYPDNNNIDHAAEKLKQTYITQPALFTLEYALANLWMSWGIIPNILVGHSIGEYVAACLAGVFSLEDALPLVATRGKLIQELPGGSMLAVFLPEKEVLQFLNEKISLSVINGPSLCVVSGEKDAIKNLETALTANKVNYRYLHTSHAFHSQMMEPILESFKKHVLQVKRNIPKIPFLSNITGKLITPQEATSPEYWVSHLRNTVRFSDCLKELFKIQNMHFLEIGPGNTLAALAQQHPDIQKNHIVLSSTPHPNETFSDRAFLLRTLGQLWMAGIKCNWSTFYSKENRKRLPLPTYPFARDRYWLESGTKIHTVDTAVSNTLQESDTLTTKKTFSENTNVINEHAESQNNVEETIANIWKGLLGLKQIGINENYFDLGGNSLMAVRLFAQIEKIYGKRLPLATLYEVPTIKQLADIISRKEYAASWASLVEIQTGGSKPPFFCMHAEGGNVLEYQALAKHLGKDQPFYGLQARGLEGEKIVDFSIEDMAAHYIREIKTIQPKGPYYIGGYCLGGLVAFEMARQLQNNGEELAFLALINTSTPDHLRNIKPNITVFHRFIYRILERIELELDNLSVLETKAKVLYNIDRIIRTKLLIQVSSEKLFDKLFSLFHLEYKWHSRAYILNTTVDLSDDSYMAYIPKPLDNRFYLFRVSKQTRALSYDPLLGWRGLARDGVHDFEVNGFHKNIIKEPNVMALAEKLKDRLDSTQALNSNTSSDYVSD